MKTRFDELLPFYVNGTLDAAERAWCDAYVREHTEAAAELGWARSLRQRLQQDVPAVSSEAGLERAMARIRAERVSAPAAQREPAVKPTWLERMRSAVSALLPQPLLRPALAGALALVAVQAVVILQMSGSHDDEATQLRTVPPVALVEKGPYLKVNFKG